MALNMDKLEHDDKAWELHQKWIDLLNEAVDYDKEIDKLYRIEERLKDMNTEELLDLADRSQESRKKHQEVDQASYNYFTYVMRLNTNSEMRDW